MTVAEPRRRPGGRSARVKAAVLDATIDELVASGYGGLTIAKVATRAGVHRTAVYRRWPTPGALLAAALLDSSADGEMPDTGTLAGDLLGLAATAPRGQGSVNDLKRAAAVTRALDAAGDDPEVASARRALWDRRLAMVEQAVARAEARGEIRRGIDPALILDVLFGAFHTRVVARGERFTAQFATDLLAMILR